MYNFCKTLSTQSVKANLGNIESCVEFLVSEQFSSGNFPSSLENDTDKLIHWCHGAPGAVHLMVKAYQVCSSRLTSILFVWLLFFLTLLSQFIENYLATIESGHFHQQVFGKDKYLSAAVKCGDVIWRRGLLKKGYGICHGVAGNAYAFLCLYKQTGDSKYLHRTLKVG